MSIVGFKKKIRKELADIRDPKYNSNWDSQSKLQLMKKSKKFRKILNRGELVRPVNKLQAKEVGEEEEALGIRALAKKKIKRFIS